MQSRMKKILFLINSLGGGGAERVLVNLVNRMDLTKYDITVETMFDDGCYRESLRPEIHYFCRHAPCPPGISKIYRFIPAPILYRYFIGRRKYDLLIAYMHGAPVKVVSGCTDKKTKRVAWLHYGNPSKGSFFSFWMSKKTAFRAYDSCDAIVGVAKSVSMAFEQFTGIHDNLYTIYNTNNSEIIEVMANQSSYSNRSSQFEICTAGRLVPQKGYDRLISAAAKLYKDGYSFHISIMGTGSESYQNKLQGLIEKCEAEDYIELIGFQSNPYAIMASSDLYVLSSREEGLATVLTEALFTGIPIVATDVSGTREVLGENSEYGLVVPNSEEGIYEGLKRLLDDPELLAHYKGKSKERASFFASEKTVAQTEELLDSVLKQ